MQCQVRYPLRIIDAASARSVALFGSKHDTHQVAAHVPQNGTLYPVLIVSADIWPSVTSRGFCVAGRSISVQYDDFRNSHSEQFYHVTTFNR